MNEFLGLAYYAEVPGGDVRHPARRALDRHADAHAAGDILSAAYASHGDTKHVLLFPRDPRGMLLPRGAGVRSRRAAADAGDRDVGSRHRHERLDVPRAQVGRRLSARSRQGARRGEIESSRNSIAISTRTATASRTARCRACIPKGAYFTRGSGHTQYGALHRGLGRIPDRARPADAQVRTAARAGARRRSSSAPRSLRHRAIVALGSSDGAVREALRHPRGDAASHVDYMRMRAFPFGEEVTKFLEHAQAGVRGRAEPRRADALAAHARDRPCDESEAAFDPALQRPADLLELHRRRASRRRSTHAPAAPAGGGAHDVHRQTEGRPPLPAEERARAHAPRLRRRHVDAVRGLRPRLDHRCDHRGVLASSTSRRTASRSCPASAARRRRRRTS